MERKLLINERSRMPEWYLQLGKFEQELHKRLKEPTLIVALADHRDVTRNELPLWIYNKVIDSDITWKQHWVVEHQTETQDCNMRGITIIKRALQIKGNSFKWDNSNPCHKMDVSCCFCTYDKYLWKWNKSFRWWKG